MNAPTPPRAARKPFRHRSAHGERLDEYHWLRDDTREDASVLDHLRAENDYCDALLSPVQPLQDALYEEIVARLKPDEASVPVFDNGYWYQARYVPEQEYAVHTRRKGRLDAPEEMLLDGNAMAQAAGGDFFEIGNYEVSPDNRWLAYAVDTVGRREYEIRIRNLETGEELPDCISRVEADLAWANDNATLLYIAKDEMSLLGDRVYAHRLGQADDRLIYQEKDDRFYMGVSRSKDGRWLLIGLSATTSSEMRYADADDPALAFRPLLPREPRHEYEAEPFGEDFIVRSNKGAPNFRLLRVPMASADDETRWTELVPARDEVLIEDYDILRDWLVINERVDGLLCIRLQSWDGTRSESIVPDETTGTMMLDHLPDIDSPVLRYAYTSLTTPAITYDHELASGQHREMKRQPVLGPFDSKDYVGEHVRVAARDGARVPVSIVRHRDTPLDGSAPLLVYGYGAYGYSLDPAFSSARLSLLNRGFVYAIAHVRGGQELGRAWYDAGRLEHKQNSFHDFIDVSDWLVEHGYGAPDRVFASGGSAGGLLVGAVANLRPDRFAGILAHVPFVDVVTTMLDSSLPLTSNEYEEWGDPREPQAYQRLLSYSPYDQVAPRHYPAMLVTTGLWDSQVQYWEPAKWVARLREHQLAEAPILFHTDLGAGHGGKSGRYERLRDTARDYAFLLWRAGLEGGLM